ncbi:MAG: hypothetical protein WD873_06085 [Candidatus Hydrogenedentales bacterium]
MTFDGRAYPGAAQGVITIFIVTALVVGLTLLRGDGQFTYALDDTYIHMAVAKHLAEYGVWGATPYEVTSCSSSILWVLLLAGAFWLFGVHDLIPLFINILFSIAFSFYLARQLAKYGVPPERCRWLVPIFLVFAPVLSTLFTGMEHVIHTLISLAFVIETVNLLERGRPTFRAALPLFVLAPLLTMARYEGLFLIAVVCVLMTFRGGFFPAVLVCVLSIIPLAVFGTAMVAAGQHFLPYSVLLKASVEGALLEPWLGWMKVDALINLVGAPRILMLLVGIVITLLAWRNRGGGFWTSPVLLMIIPAAAVLLHAEFANLRLVRYVVYLMVLLAFALAVHDGPLFEKGLRVRRDKRVAAWGVLAFSLFIGPISLLLMPLATINIYQQQRQMAEFFGMYYDDVPVAINDLGTTAYYTGGPLVDLWGLASGEVAEAKLAGEYDPEKIDEICRAKDVKVAIVYDHWFEDYGGLPAHWVRAGQWRIPNNVVCAGNTVSIYAVDPAEAPALVANLRAFSEHLPPPVQEFGLYTKEPAKSNEDTTEPALHGRNSAVDPQFADKT